ncbi:MarR family transcriptional regulator [Natrialbaceae archaeon A-CW1-1]
MYEAFDGVAGRTLLAIEPGDSIRQVAQRTHTPYETVRQAVNTLEEAGFVRYNDGLYVSDDRVADAALDFAAVSAQVDPPTVDEAYVIPQFAAAPYAFTRIDAVYVWTRGGYQVGRDKADYPLFLAVGEEGLEYWEEFFDRFGIPVAFERRPADEVDGSIQFVLEPRSELEVEWVDGYPVISLEETIEYMQEHYVHFQSALEMLDRMYDELDLDVTYRDPGVAQP